MQPRTSFLLRPQSQTDGGDNNNDHSDPRARCCATFPWLPGPTRKEWTARRDTERFMRKTRDEAENVRNADRGWVDHVDRRGKRGKANREEVPLPRLNAPEHPRWTGIVVTDPKLRRIIEMEDEMYQANSISRDWVTGTHSGGVDQTNAFSHFETVIMSFVQHSPHAQHPQSHRQTSPMPGTRTNTLDGAPTAHAPTNGQLGALDGRPGHWISGSCTSDPYEEWQLFGQPDAMGYAPARGFSATADWNTFPPPRPLRPRHVPSPPALHSTLWTSTPGRYAAPSPAPAPNAKAPKTPTDSASAIRPRLGAPPIAAATLLVPTSCKLTPAPVPTTSTPSALGFRARSTVNPPAITRPPSSSMALSQAVPSTSTRNPPTTASSPDSNPRNTKTPYTTAQKTWLITYIQQHFPNNTRKSWKWIQTAYNTHFHSAPRTIGGLTLLYQRFVNSRADLPEPATIDYLVWTPGMDGFIMNWVDTKWEYGVARDWDRLWDRFWDVFGAECEELDADRVLLRREGEGVRMGIRGKPEVVGRCKELEEMVGVKGKKMGGKGVAVEAGQDFGLEEDVGEEQDSPDAAVVVIGKKRARWCWAEEGEWLRSHDAKRIRGHEMANVSRGNTSTTAKDTSIAMPTSTASASVRAEISKGNINNTEFALSHESCVVAQVLTAASASVVNGVISTAVHTTEVSTVVDFEE